MASLIDMLSLNGAKNTPYIEQSEASECGLACLAMVASYHGYQTDMAAMRRRFSMSLKGATLTNLMEVADSLGLNSRPLRGEMEDLRHLSLPAILHWNLNHFVVLAKIKHSLKGPHYVIHDPAQGEVTLSAAEVSKHWTGVALDLMKSENFKPKVEQSQLRITQLWTAIDGFWGIFSNVLLLSLVLQVIALAGPFYLQLGIDTALPAQDNDLLFMLALGFGGLAVINLITSWIRSLVLVNLNSALSFQIIANLFRHLVRLPLSWFEKRHTGDIISRFGSTQPISQLLSQGMIAAIVDGIMAFLTLILMFVYSVMLGSIALVALLLYLVIRLSFLHAIRLRNVDVITTAAKEESNFIESVRGVSAIKAFGQEGNRERLWQQTKANAINAEIRLGRLSVGFEAIGQFIIAVELVIFVYIAVNQAFEGLLTVGMIFAFQAYKQQFLDASMRLVEQAINYQILKVHLARISDIALAKIESSSEINTVAQADFTKPLVLENVSYRYGSNEQPVLQNISLTFQPGTFIAITGPSGGGKTTLVKILLGLFDPTSGAVKVGHRPISSISRSEYRRRIGSVAQGDILYAGSLAENIAFFDPEIAMHKVHEVARQANIHDEIEAMPLGYETLVGDMGSVLSSGQLQRVLLARALYGDPAILIMDEGTANLDAPNERKILDSLKKLQITRIAIAHRSAILDEADHVMVLAGGWLRPMPKPKEVVQSQGDQHAGK